MTLDAIVLAGATTAGVALVARLGARLAECTLSAVPVLAGRAAFSAASAVRTAPAVGAVEVLTARSAGGSIVTDAADTQEAVTVGVPSAFVARKAAPEIGRCVGADILAEVGRSDLVDPSVRRTAVSVDRMVIPTAQYQKCRDSYRLHVSTLTIGTI